MFGYQNDKQSDSDQDMVANQVTTTQQPTSSGWDTPAPTNNVPATPLSDTATQAGNPELEALSSNLDAPTVQPAASDDLLNIKQQALGQLSPLIDHLDQTPEERFNTTMMMIQASDNQSLIKSAYDAAQQIGDEKKKAQALLDIVNEINYFTHKGQLDNSQA